MNDKLAAKWNEAAARPGEKIPLDGIVVCDYCDADYTDRPDCGGLLFGSKAICPACAPRYRRDIARHHEERFIRGECPPSVSFADWVRGLRGPDAFIRVTAR